MDQGKQEQPSLSELIVSPTGELFHTCGLRALIYPIYGLGVLSYSGITLSITIPTIYFMVDKPISLSNN